MPATQDAMRASASNSTSRGTGSLPLPATFPASWPFGQPRLEMMLGVQSIELASRLSRAWPPANTGSGGKGRKPATYALLVSGHDAPIRLVVASHTSVRVFTCRSDALACACANHFLVN